MGNAGPVLRGRPSSAMPPAPASQTCRGADVPKPAWIPQAIAAATRPSNAGAPSRKKAAKLTTTSASIKASVATTPARAAAAIVAPFGLAGLLAATGAYATWDVSFCLWPPPDAHRDVQECSLPFDVIPAAIP